MTGFRKVNTGDKLVIPADDYNAAMDAAKDFARRRGGSTFAAPKSDLQQTRRLVQNNGTAIAQAGGILGLNGPLFNNTQNLNEFIYNTSFKGVTPATPTHTGKFVVSLGPSPAAPAPGSISEFVVSGIAVCQVYMNSSTDAYADVANGQQGYLTSGSGSAQLLWTAGTSGLVWAVVRLGVPTAGAFVCKISSNIPAMSGSTLGSGTATLWTLSGATASATSTTLTVYNTTESAIAAQYGNGDYKLLQGKYINGVPCIDVEGCS